MLNKIIKLKEGLKESRLRELLQVEKSIEALATQIRLLEEQMKEVEDRLKENFSEGLLFRYRALLSKKEECLKALRGLETEREEKRQRLKEVYAEIKLLDVVRRMKERESTVRSINVESQRLDYLHLIRGREKHD